MSVSLNKVMLIGRLGKDPEIRYTKSGTAVASMSVATEQTYKDRNGKKQKQTEWHNVVAWAKVADFASEYLKKGREVYVEGRNQTRDWTDKEGGKHYKTEIVAQRLQFVGPKPANENHEPGDAVEGEADQPPPDDDMPFQE